MPVERASTQCLVGPAVTMKLRTFRCPDDLWDAARRKAKSDGGISTVIRRLLFAYVREETH